jgi:hypothetical protein
MLGTVISNYRVLSAVRRGGVGITWGVGGPQLAS